MAISVIICSFLLAKDAHRKGINKDDVIDFVFWVVVFGILGARVFYILMNLSFFLDDPLEMIMLQHGGLAWQGSFVSGTITSILYARRKKWPLFMVLDLGAPYLALGQSIGRIGCFLNGCCYGHASSWGIYFPVHGARLIPTQLYSMAGLFCVFLILKKSQRKVMTPGFIFVKYLYLAASLRFFIEFARADHFVLLGGLSVYQYVCLGIFSMAVILTIVLKKTDKRV